MKIQIEGKADCLLENAARILERELTDRSIDAAVTLSVDSTLPAESFCITREDEQTSIVGGDSNGVLYGCGRLIRQWPNVDFSGEVSIPEKSFRAMYLATQMDNIYHAGPLSVIQRYIEELALYGINTLSLCTHLFHFQGFSDPECQAYLDRLNALYDTARRVGMKTCLAICPNDGYLNTPESMAFEGKVPRNWGTEICPDKPGAMEQIRSQFRDVFNHLSEINYLILWPYDGGGCHCEVCRPWGVNGFYRVAEPVAEEFRTCFPQGKVILSTWMFDYNCGDHGEFDAFYHRLADGRLDFMDMMMADGAHVNGYFPQRVLDQPPDCPVVGFLEITMRHGAPWGSFGSNPMPAFLEEEWNRVKNTIDGGTPYSEGIFEDINKFIWSQLCWSPDRPVRSILEEYAVYVASAECATEIADTMYKIEKVGRREPADLETNRILLPDTRFCAEAWQVMERIDRKLPRTQRRGWRWRLLLLRARIDAELARSGGTPTAALGRAYDELREMYCVTEKSLWFVCPYEVRADPGSGELRFVQPGRGLEDICERFDKEQDEQLLD